ncbi:type II toxin-antitoxin system VapC family toxin [Treponema primitia]|uniref:type II toxin-antitoxin system VapC family toxin n=1 Tax=Treponema primitia TaxID=88058 RepID=UPI00398108FD
MNYILDCSFIIPLILAEDNSDAVETEFNKISESDNIYVPQLFWYEIANVMKKAIRKNRITNLDAIKGNDHNLSAACKKAGIKTIF